MEKKPVYITNPSMPPLNEFTPFLEKIWENRQLTNNGDFHKQLESELQEYLGVNYISLFCNGTIALLAAIKVLGITGEVITTPFNFIAAAHALRWNNIEPVFVDIDPVTFNLDPEQVKPAITDSTTAILPFHVYGIPCETAALQEIADKHDLKVIYDAAHAFGVKKDGVSILNYGDLSVLSFHATKSYTTLEGGAIVSHDEGLKSQIDRLKNFGFNGESQVMEFGINGKMNEFQAAFGILYLKYINSYIEMRKSVTFKYREMLRDIPGLKLMNDLPGVDHNYSYFPIFIDEEKYGQSRDMVHDLLKKRGYNCRRYFYPLITDFPIYKRDNKIEFPNLPVARKAAEQVLCLPVYPELDLNDIQDIASIIREV